MVKSSQSAFTWDLREKRKMYNIFKQLSQALYLTYLYNSHSYEVNIINTIFFTEQIAETER